MQRLSFLAALCLATACADTTAPAKVGTLATVSTGSVHTCGLNPAGAAYCWGGGALTPTAVVMPAGMAFTTLSAGGDHVCALNATGAAYCWGENLEGQVGDGTTTNRLTPVPAALPAGMSFASIGSGTYHSCGLTIAGEAHCWGDNVYGQLGDGTTTDHLTPTAVTMPAGVSFTSLAVGWIHACGLTAAGAAYCWGNNDDGQIGDSTTTSRPIPTAVSMPVGVTFTMLAVGSVHTCGVTQEGAVYCWGANHRGRLGDGTTTNRLTPTATVIPGGVTIKSVGAGYAHACALTVAGAVYCWGRNVFGELGDGTTTDRLSATPVATPAGVMFSSLAVGFVHTCVLTAEGAAYCWGVNTGGRLGDGTTMNRLIPVKVVQD